LSVATTSAPMLAWLMTPLSGAPTHEIAHGRIGMPGCMVAGLGRAVAAGGLGGALLQGACPSQRLAASGWTTSLVARPPLAAVDGRRADDGRRRAGLGPGPGRQSRWPRSWHGWAGLERWWCSAGCRSSTACGAAARAGPPIAATRGDHYDMTAAPPAFRACAQGPGLAPVLAARGSSGWAWWPPTRRAGWPWCWRDGGCCWLAAAWMLAAAGALHRHLPGHLGARPSPPWQPPRTHRLGRAAAAILTRAVNTMADLRLHNLRETLRRGHRGAAARPGGGQRRVRRAAGRVRLRQEHHAAHGGRAGRGDRRADPDRRARRHPRPPHGARHRHGVPELRPLSAHGRGAEHVVRLAPGRPQHGRDRSQGGGGGQGAEHRAPAGSASPRNCRAGSASGWPSVAPSCASRRSSCSTNRCPTWTPSCAATCAPSWRCCTSAWARPRCTSRTTRWKP
jgi:hypothetical protein